MMKFGKILTNLNVVGIPGGNAEVTKLNFRHVGEEVVEVLFEVGAQNHQFHTDYFVFTSAKIRQRSEHCKIQINVSMFCYVKYNQILLF